MFFNQFFVVVAVRLVLPVSKKSSTNVSCDITVLDCVQDENEHLNLLRGAHRETIPVLKSHCSLCLIFFLVYSSHVPIDSNILI